MTTPMTLPARRAALLGLRDALDAGSSPGALLFYTGTAPATPGAATAETLLGSVPLAVPSGAIGQGTVLVGGVPQELATLTLAVPRTAPASSTGVIGFARLQSGAGDAFMDFSVGLPGSGATVIVNAVQVFAGGELQLLSCVLAM